MQFHGLGSPCLAELLTSVRKSHSLTHGDVARYLSIHRSTYSYYETGKNVPPLKTLVFLSNLYSLPYTDFVYAQLRVPRPYYSELDCRKRMAEQQIICTIRHMEQSEFYAWNSHVPQEITGNLKESLKKWNPAAQDQSATNFGSVLRYARIKRDKLHSEVAAELQLSRSSYSGYEENKTVPTLELIFDLSEFLHYPFLSLLHERSGDAYVLYGEDKFSRDRHWAEKLLLSSLAMIPDSGSNKLFLDFQSAYIDKNQWINP